MPVEPGVIDANILIYAVNVDAKQNAASRHLLEAALDSASKLFVTSQILCEFYSIITNPKRVTAAVSATAAIEIIAAFLELPGLHLLAAPLSTVTRLMELLKRRPVTGSDVFDLQIVATMLANDIRRIYTFNAEDFKIFPELTVTTPSS